MDILPQSRNWQRPRAQIVEVARIDVAKRVECLFQCCRAGRNGVSPLCRWPLRRVHDQRDLQGAVRSISPKAVVRTTPLRRSVAFITSTEVSSLRVRRKPLRPLRRRVGRHMLNPESAGVPRAISGRCGLELLDVAENRNCAATRWLYARRMWHLVRSGLDSCDFHAFKSSPHYAVADKSHQLPAVLNPRA